MKLSELRGCAMQTSGLTMIARSSFRVLPSASLVFLSVLGLSVSGCSALGSLNPFGSSDTTSTPTASEQPSGDSTQAGEVEARKESGEPPLSARTTVDTAHKSSVVEVIWQVPTEPVETYHLYYGLAENDLSNHVAIPIAELERATHPRFGPVYRYRLRDIPSHQTVFISLAAENRAGMSPKTPVARIEPGQQTIAP